MRHAGKTRRPSRSGLNLRQRRRRPSGRARPKSQAGGKRRVLQQCPTHRHTRCPTGCHGKSQLCPPWQCWSTQHCRPMRTAANRLPPLGSEEVRVAEGAKSKRGAGGVHCRKCNRCRPGPGSFPAPSHNTNGIRERAAGAAVVVAGVGDRRGRGAARPREPRMTASGEVLWPWRLGVVPRRRRRSTAPRQTDTMHADETGVTRGKTRKHGAGRMS